MKKFAIIAILITACGHKAPPPGKPDISPPIVKIIYPENGDTLSGDTIKVKTSIKDSSRIKEIQLILDGQSILTTHDTDSLFFSTGELSDTIPHTLVIRARDEWDNWGISPPVRFFVK